MLSKVAQAYEIYSELDWSVKTETKFKLLVCNKLKCVCVCDQSEIKWQVHWSLAEWMCN